MSRTRFQRCSTTRESTSGGAVYVASGARLIQGDADDCWNFSSPAPLLKSCQKPRWPAFSNTAGNSFHDNNPAGSGCMGPNVYAETCDEYSLTLNTQGAEIQCGSSACHEFFVLLAIPEYCAMLVITLLVWPAARRREVRLVPPTGALDDVPPDDARRPRSSSQSLREDYEVTTELGSNIGTLLYLASLAASRMAVLLTVSVPWGTLGKMFGWLSMFMMPTPPMPAVSERTVIGLAIALPVLAQVRASSCVVSERTVTWLAIALLLEWHRLGLCCASLCCS